MSDLPNIFDMRLVGQRRDRAKSSAMGDLPLAKEAAEGLAERLMAVNRRFEQALDLDSPESEFAPIALVATRWTRASVFSDHMALDLPAGRFDLAVSLLALHAVNDLPGVLAQIRRALKPDGLFMATM